MNVSRFCDMFRLPQPTVSHHLGLLRRGGLLTMRREGKSIHYALDGKLESPRVRAEHPQHRRRRIRISKRNAVACRTPHACPNRDSLNDSASLRLTF